jgi:hypothetical protein
VHAEGLSTTLEIPTKGIWPVGLTIGYVRIAEIDQSIGVCRVIKDIPTCEELIARMEHEDRSKPSCR